MKKSFAGLLLTGLMVLSPLPALAEVDEATARNVMQETGLSDSLAKMPAALRDGMKSGLAGAGAMLPPEIAQRILAAVDGAFTPERTQATALDAMRKGLDTATVTEVRKWNATPLGQRLLAQEKLTAGRTDTAKVATDAQAALQGADAARRKVLTDIVDATKAVDGMVDMSLTTAVAMMRGMMAGMPTAQGMPPEEQLRGMLETQIAGAKPQMQAAAVTGLAGVYASFTTAELEQYLAHLRTPTGARMSELTLSTLGAVMKEGATEIGRRMSAPAKPAG